MIKNWKKKYTRSKRMRRYTERESKKEGEGENPFVSRRMDANLYDIKYCFCSSI